MSLMYGIPPVDPERRICFNCQHFNRDIDPHSGWGVCDRALNGKTFRNHTKTHVYTAKHSNGRYYNQTACKVRFKSNREGNE